MSTGNAGKASGTRSIKSEIEEFKRNGILKEAVAQFYDHGYETTSVDSIADALGVTKPYIYARFRSKVELLIEICKLGAAPADLTVEFGKGLDGDPAATLYAIIRHFVTLQIERRMEVALYFREAKSLPPAELQVIDEARLRFHHMLRNVLDEGRKSGVFHMGSAALTASALGGMASWTFTWFQPDGRWDGATIADEIAKLALRTVGAS